MTNISDKAFDDVFDYQEYTNLCRENNVFPMSNYTKGWRDHWESIVNKGIVR